MNTMTSSVPKKEYHSPKLIEYGNIRELTQASANGTNADGAYSYPTTTSI